MTLKRLILIGLTLIVSLLIGLSLLDSLFQPQTQSQLELYQTDLVLQASEWRGLETEDKSAAWQKLLGGEPVQNALQQYNEMRRSLQKSLEQALKPDLTSGDRPPSLSPALLKKQLAQLDLRIGLLSTRADKTEQAQQTWATVTAESTQAVSPSLSDSAQILAGLWSQPPQVLSQAEATLTTTLKGWFRYQALKQLYQVQPQPEALAKLDLAEQAAAESAALRLAVVGGIPTLGGLFGSGLLLFWLVKTGIKTYRQQNSDSVVAEAGTSIAATAVPWQSETIWQVMVLWFTAFFGVSLAFVPLLARLLGVTAGSVSPLTQAAFALLTYSLLMATGFTILYVSIRPFVAQPLTWLPLKLTGNWFWWGLAGYFAVLPLVFVVSLINQQLLQNHGGGNPILEIILGSHDRLTIGILWLMVAVLAPVFEETLFRGFFLTSLTRYLPTWSAIALSGGVFAIAHLNLADILPLTVLGMGLGYVYLRSGNLLASMLLHGIWNSGSFLGLLLLSSSQSN